MKELVLNILMIVVIIAAVFATMIASVMLIVSNLYIKPFTPEDIRGIDFTGFRNASTSKSKSIIIKANTCIANGNPFDIGFSKLFIEMFYNNELIASSENIDEKTYTIPSLKENEATKIKEYGKLCFPESVQIFINPTTIDLFLNKIFNKTPVKIKYKLSFKVFGVWIGKGIIPAIEGEVAI